MKTPTVLKHTPLLSLVFLVALVLFAAVLVVSAVNQFAQGHWFSGCVSILGVLLVGAATALLILDLRKKAKDGEENG